MHRLHQQILRVLLRGPAGFWELLPLQDGDLAGFSIALSTLEQEGFITRQSDGRLALTPQGKNLPDLPLPLEEWQCPYCQGTGMVTQGLFAEVHEKWERLANNRPTPSPAFDQGYVTPRGAIGRVLFMYRRGDLERRRLLFLGDDDLASMAAALTGLPRRITVLEIDEKIVNFLNATAAEEGWDNFKAQIYDVQNPLPPNCKEHFDAAVTDPVETWQGFLLFLSRCTEALTGVGGAVYFGLSRIETDSPKWQQWLREILDMGFALTDLLPAFHHYQIENTAFVPDEYPETKRFLPPEAPNKAWYSSSLVRLEAVGKPKPLYRGTMALGNKLYHQ